MQQVEKGLYQHHMRVKEGKIAPRNSAPMSLESSHRYAAVNPRLNEQQEVLNLEKLGTCTRDSEASPTLCSKLLLSSCLDSVVDEVSSDSPAQTAGLQGMQALAAAVQKSKDQDMTVLLGEDAVSGEADDIALQVVVMREGEAKTTNLTLRPQPVRVILNKRPPFAQEKQENSDCEAGGRGMEARGSEGGLRGQRRTEEDRGEDRTGRSQRTEEDRGWSKSAAGGAES
eukprot:758023-Hanusia_phi.AAC.2